MCGVAVKISPTAHIGWPSAYHGILRVMIDPIIHVGVTIGHLRLPFSDEGARIVSDINRRPAAGTNVAFVFVSPHDGG